MAGEAKAKISRSLTVGGLTIGGVVGSFPSDGAIVFQKEIPANSTNARITIPVDVSTVIAAGMDVNKDADIYTNAPSTSSSPAPTDSFVPQRANKAIIWSQGDAAALFLTADVTDIYITTGGEATLFKLGCAVDTTPVLS